MCITVETNYFLQIKILPIHLYRLPDFSPPTWLFENWIMFRDVQINANKTCQNSQNWLGEFFFHMQQPSWCHQVHSTQQWSVRNIALQREGITLVLANCACKRSNIWTQPCWKLATAQGKCVWNGWNQKRAFNEPQLFNICFWLWSWVTLSTLKNIHNHFDMEGVDSEKLP